MFLTCSYLFPGAVAPSEKGGEISKSGRRVQSPVVISTALASGKNARTLNWCGEGERKHGKSARDKGKALEAVRRKAEYPWESRDRTGKIVREHGNGREHGNRREHGNGREDGLMNEATS